MDHLHDELDETDLKFLQRFGKIEDEADDSHDFVDEEGVEQAREHDPMTEDAPHTPHDVDPEDLIDADIDADENGDDISSEGEGDESKDGDTDDYEQGDLNQDSDDEGIADGESGEQQTDESGEGDGDDAEFDPESDDDLMQGGEGESESENSEGEPGDEPNADAEGESDSDKQQELDDLLDQQGEGEQEGDGEQESEGEQEKDTDPEGSEQLSDEGEGEPDDDAQDKDSDPSDEADAREDQQRDEQEQREGEQDEQQDDGEGNQRKDEQERGECDGDCKENEDDDDTEPCPYCTEKKKREQQRRSEPTPVAMDAWGKPIFVGDEIESCGNGVEQDEYDRYTAVCMGVAFGHTHDAPNERMIVVKRRDGVTGGWEVNGEGKMTAGWGVQSSLCTVIGHDEGDQQQQEHKHDQQQKDELGDLDEMLQKLHDQFEKDDPQDSGEDEGEQQQQDDDSGDDEQQEEKKQQHHLGYDVDGTPVCEGDSVEFIKSDGLDRFPVGSIGILRAVCKQPDNGNTYPGFVIPLPADSKGDWHYEGQRSWTFREGNTVDYVRKITEGEQQEQQQDEWKDEDGRETQELTQTQDDRFHNLFDRIADKSRATFGQTLESENVGPDAPGGVFDGEAVSKTLEIESRGVTYRVTLSAVRYKD